MNEPVEASDEKCSPKPSPDMAPVDLLCIDEFGHMELDRCGAELSFQVLTERERKNSIVIASNESFFTDRRLCTGIVDRLTFNGPAPPPPASPTPIKPDERLGPPTNRISRIDSQPPLPEEMRKMRRPKFLSTVQERQQTPASQMSTPVRPMHSQTWSWFSAPKRSGSSPAELPCGHGKDARIASLNCSSDGTPAEPRLPG